MDYHQGGLKHSMNKILLPVLSIIFVVLISLPSSAWAFTCIPPTCGACCPPVLKACQDHCLCVSNAETGTPDKPDTTLGHISSEFQKQRKWLVDQFFKEPNKKDQLGILAAFKIITSQLTTVGMLQVEAIGTFFDAKHQLETQRIFQQLTTKAHKDYHASEGLCEIGTISKSLAASSRVGAVVKSTFSKRSTDRQLLAKDTIGVEGSFSDKRSRLRQFIKKYCDKDDNMGNLSRLCMKSENKRELFNKDINYTSTIDTPLTLDLDLSNQGQDKTDDEEAIFALTANLFAHELAPEKNQNFFLTDKEEPNMAGAAGAYLDWRALVAKRSVAANSFASIISEKTKGDAQAQPFIYSFIQEITKGKEQELAPEEIEKLLGDKPSYYAQMEVLTKTLYQSPTFYADLYDKPANVLRKDVAIQAATLMQKRDLYHSYLRSEMLLAVMLETALIDEQTRIENEFGPAFNTGEMEDPRQ